VAGCIIRFRTLDLVTGPPFTGATGHGYSWAHTEGVVRHATIAIDNAAHQLADHALNRDDPPTATWAARKGILVTRSCEQCYRNLMAADVAANNPTAVEAAYQQLLATITADDGPDATDHLDPETTAAARTPPPPPPTPPLTMGRYLPITNPYEPPSDPGRFKMLSNRSLRWRIVG